MLPSSGLGYSVLAPIWYLSAMAIVLPMVIYLMRKHRDLWYILSWLLPLLYYGHFGINTNRQFPNDIVRAFAGIALGTFLYLLVIYITKKKISKPIKIILSVFETMLFAGALVISLANKGIHDSLLYFFAGNLVLMLSQQTYSAKLSGCFFQFLGEISMPMFISHWTVGTAVNHLSDDMTVKTVLYYALTVSVSAIAVAIIKAIKKYSGKRNSIL